MQPSIDSFPSPGRIHMDTLNPPKSAIAPIAPFIGDHELPQQLAIAGLFQFGDHEKSTVGRFKEGNSPVMQAVEIEAAPLCFKSHGCTERLDHCCIFWLGESNIHMVED